MPSPKNNKYISIEENNISKNSTKEKPQLNKGI